MRLQMPRSRAFALAALLACAEAHGQGAMRPPLDGEAAVQFVQRAEAYARVRGAAAEEVPALKETPSPVEIGARERALADAIRGRRAGARRGDLFDGAGAAIRALVREDWQARSGAERAALWRQIPSVGAPAVNSSYPAELPLATFPPALLARLPALPEVLEYRFAGAHLILRDAEANLVVDVLPGVLQDPGAPRLGAESDR
jgi:hypothetical protein